MRNSIEKTVLKLVSGESGFALSEAVVSVGLMGIIAAVFLTGLSNMFRGDLIAKQQATAESLARAQVESVKGEYYISYASAGHDVYDPIVPPDGYDVSFTVVPINPVTGVALAAGTDNGLQQITVTVSRNGNTLLTLSDYKVLR